MAQKYIEGDVVMYHNKIMVVKEPRDGSNFDLSCPKERLVYNLVDIENIMIFCVTIVLVIQVIIKIQNNLSKDKKRIRS